MLTKKATKQFLDDRIFGEVDKVINVEAQRKWFVGNVAVRVVGITYEACEETRIFEGGGETNGNENFIDLVIPVTWAMPKTIQGPKKKPIFIRCSFRIT
jgi:hypothetical protein